MYYRIDLNQEIFSVTFTIYLREKVINTFAMDAPRPFLEIQFINLMQEIISQKEPMKVVMSREEIIWDKFEQKNKVLPITMEFYNYQEGNNTNA